MKKITSAMLAFGLISSANVVTAEERDSFTGSIGIGATVIDSSNNLNPNGSEDRLNDLSSSAEGDSSVQPLLLIKTTWDVGAADGLKMYLSTTPPIDEVGGFAIDLGSTYRLSGIGIVSGGLFFLPFAEAWEDPYLVGADREETDTSKFGAKIGLNRIMGSGLRLGLVYMIDDVDDDVIGERISELARDGVVYALNMNYSFYPTDNLEIRPRLTVRQGDYDGEANSYTKYKAELETRYVIDKVAIIPRAYVSYSEYNELNPLFNETREDEGYGLSMVINYMAPFNFTNWSITGIASASEGDSNIDFYDSEAFSFGAFVSYNF
ncbi:MAG: DUF2860 domain-containing protein [Desulfobulbaceae bacterium]|nr:DUF2860 domain-containing protein [Desulfobulbaceae bacterium]